MVTMTSISDIEKYIFAGRSVFTLKSLKTGDHFTFKVKNWKKNPNIHFVNVRTNNGFEPIAKIMFKKQVSISRNSVVNARSPQFKALEWSLERLLNKKELPRELEFYHDGRCGKCSRPLTHPDSLKAGLGPECYFKCT